MLGDSHQNAFNYLLKAIKDKRLRRLLIGIAIIISIVVLAATFKESLCELANNRIPWICPTPKEKEIALKFTTEEFDWSSRSLRFSLTNPPGSRKARVTDIKYHIYESWIYLARLEERFVLADIIEPSKRASEWSNKRTDYFNLSDPYDVLTDRTTIVISEDDSASFCAKIYKDINGKYFVFRISVIFLDTQGNSHTLYSDKIYKAEGYYRLPTIEHVTFIDVAQNVNAIRNNKRVNFYLLPMLVQFDLDRADAVRYLLKQFEVVRHHENRSLYESCIYVLNQLAEKSDFPVIERILHKLDSYEDFEDKADLLALLGRHKYAPAQQLITKFLELHSETKDEVLDGCRVKNKLKILQEVLQEY